MDPKNFKQSLEICVKKCPSRYLHSMEVNICLNIRKFKLNNFIPTVQYKISRVFLLQFHSIIFTEKNLLF